MKPELGTDAINAIVYSQYSPGLADFFESFRPYLSIPEMIRLGNYIANDLLRELKYHETPLDYFNNTVDMDLYSVLWLYSAGKIDKLTATEHVRSVFISDKKWTDFEGKIKGMLLNDDNPG